MITKQDILDRAVEWHLRPDVVEKDYVLGWLLAAVSRVPEIMDNWVFKGGTCIKKCYLETYRFSEDLDFSLAPASVYAAEELRAVLRSLARAAGELSGIIFPEDLIEIRERHNKQGLQTFQGKLAYGGPLRQMNTTTPPRVLFDLTRHEPVIDGPTPRPVFHPYPDVLPDGATVPAYSLDELLAEKTRALYERTRPRDLYDVVYILDNPPGDLHLERVNRIFGQKCIIKDLKLPTVGDLVQLAERDEELRSEWANMLAHQLPNLPQLTDLLVRLPRLIAWVEQPTAVLPDVALPGAPVGVGESSVIGPGIRYWGSGLPLEAIRFAGANRLLVEFDYHGRHRTVAPYSLRRAATGNLLLYAQEVNGEHIKAFKVAEMINVRSSRTAFNPRYRIELTASGPLSVPYSAASVLPRAYPRSHGRTGPTYVFRCPQCQKEFRHSKNDSSLRKHKNDYGWDCRGRRGYYERTEY
ncbi:MAG: nucleotidyl transferase AbiEii/AbiGii toxin family protein [Bryobacteraceae bacterium]|jgi:predicted nucleotidyltransferase component of viral defense system